VNKMINNYLNDKKIGFYIIVFIFMTILTGQASALPDLVVSNVAYSDIEVDMITSFNSTIENTGDENSSGFYVYLLIDDSFYTSQYISGLQANAQKNITLNWIAVGGFHNFSVIADATMSIAEIDESNNYNSFSLPYIPGYDLVVENITWTPDVSNVTFETVFTFNASIRNIGERNMSVKDIYVDFSVDGNKIASGYKYTV